jgi:saxitoxin biosynthesis operon SxtJ-like protein
MGSSKPTPASHERLSADENNTPGSDRQFGIVIAAAFALLSLLNLWRSGGWWHWTLTIAALFATAAIFVPNALRPLNLVWFKFGMLLHRMINPAIMALLYYVSVTPTGLIMRVLGKDLLRLKLDRNAETYWIAREPPGPAPETMKDQF